MSQHTGRAKSKAVSRAQMKEAIRCKEDSRSLGGRDVEGQESWNFVEEKERASLRRPQSRWRTTFPFLFPLTDVWRSAVGFFL